MKNRIYLFPLTALIIGALACNLSSAANATLSPAEIDTLSAQTLIALQESDARRARDCSPRSRGIR